VENLVSIELSYINTKHPDFTEAGAIHKKLTDTMEHDMRKISVKPDRGDGKAQYPAVHAAEERVSRMFVRLG